MMTGLALGKDVGVCDACNTNVEWIMSYPSTLLWADKFCLQDQCGKTYRRQKVLSNLNWMRLLNLFLINWILKG